MKTKSVQFDIPKAAICKNLINRVPEGLKVTMVQYLKGIDPHINERIDGGDDGWCYEHLAEQVRVMQENPESFEVVEYMVQAYKTAIEDVNKAARRLC